LNTHPERFTALVLAAHGDRGGPGRNESLARHVAALAKRNEFVCVTGGVLNGEPALEAALQQAEQNGAKQILLYPMFMSDGYFVQNILPERIAAARLKVPHKILKPFGLDRRVPLMMLENALRAAGSAELDPAKLDLLIAGHGSKFGPGNADATRAAALAMTEHSPFRTIDVAFLEEEPFILDALRKHHNRSVVAGFFSGEGMHAGDDIPEAISKSGAAAIYAGPIGLDPRVPELIASTALHSLASIAPQPQSEPSPSPEPAAEPSPAPAATSLPNPAMASISARSQAPSPETNAPQAHAPQKPANEPEMPKVAEQAQESQPSRKRGGGMSGMRFLFKAVFTLLLMAMLAIGAIAFLVPQDVVRDQLASLVKQQIGRDLTIKGKTSFSIFPNIGVNMEDVSISNPPGMPGKNLLSMSSLNLNLKLLPLLSRRIEVERFVLVRPVFNLQVDGRGRKNWEFKKSSAVLSPPPDRKPQVMMQAQAGGIGVGVVEGISLGTAKIVDGTMIYSDQRSGAKQRLDAINVEFVQHGLTDPLVTKGTVEWRKEDISFSGSFDDVPALLRNQLSKAVFSLTTRHGTGSFDGSLAATASLVAKGAVNVKTPSLRALAAWLGNPLPPGGGLGPIKITGQFDLKGDRVTFTKAKIALDGMTGNGQAAVKLKGVRPHITATLAFDKLDFNPYLSGTVTGVAPPRAKQSKNQPSASQPKEKQSLTDLINKLNKPDGKSGAKPEPQVRAWNQRAIDLTGLRMVDADLKLTTQALFYKKIKAGKSALSASLKSGVLKVGLTKLALYSGSGTGTITLNGARATPVFSVRLTLKDISALPLLTNAVNFKWISGRANLAIDVTGSGRSQSDIMRSLKGKSNLVFADGAIEGINIPAMMRGLKQGQFGGWKSKAHEKTDFSKLSGSFLIQDGIAYNKDLTLVGPLVRLTCEGNVDLGRERIDYAALPRIVASLQGQGANEDRKGIAVPVRITGPWEKPKIVPDLQRLLNDPELAKETAEKVGKVLDKLKNKKDFKKMLDGFLGGGNQNAGAGTDAGGGAGAQPQGEQVKPEDLLKKLFR